MSNPKKISFIQKVICFNDFLSIILKFQTVRVIYFLTPKPFEPMFQRWGMRKANKWVEEVNRISEVLDGVQRKSKPKPQPKPTKSK